MADLTEVTLEQYHQAIEKQLAAAFPQFKKVVAYPEDRADLGKYPAITFEVTEMDGAHTHDGGDGKMSMSVRIDAHLIFPFEIKNITRLAPSVAAAVAQHVHQRRWGLYCEPAEVVGCYKDSFDAELDQFVVWRVEWHQVLDLGASVWADDENFVLPTDVRVQG